MQTIAAAAALLTLLGWFAWQWNVIAAQLAGLKNEWQMLLTPASLLAIAVSLAFCFILLCPVMIFTFRSLMKNDFSHHAH